MDAIKAFLSPSRQPGTPAPLTPDESLKSAAVDNGIDFTKKDSHWPDIRTRKSGLLDRTTALEAYRNMPAFLHKLPKCELHVHLEGTITPDASGHRDAQPPNKSQRV